jgi:hypothetical protein
VSKTNLTASEIETKANADRTISPMRAAAPTLAVDPAYLAAARADGAKEGAAWAFNYVPGGPWYARGSTNETPDLAAYHRDWLAGFRVAMAARVVP